MNLLLNPFYFLATEATLLIKFPTAGESLMYLSGIIFFLLLNAFFVASEFALVKVRPSQLEALAKEKPSQIRIAMDVTNHLDSYLSANQLGITFSSLALGFLGEPFVKALVTPILIQLGVPTNVIYAVSLILAYASFTFLHVVIGELIPKSIAIRHPLRTTLLLVAPLRLFYKIFRFVIAIFQGTANAILKYVFHLEVNTHGHSVHSAEELALLVMQSGKSQEVTETEREILINALELNDLWVRDVMTPRNQVIVLDIKNSFQKNLEVAIKSKHTRFPLVNGYIDQSIGLIHIKDLFKLLDNPTPDLLDIKRDMKVVPDTMPLDSLLKFFLKEHAHLALVVDEFGTPVGIVFLDNVIEQLVGDIQDEFDNERSQFHAVNDDDFIIDGSMTLNDLAGHVEELFLESGEVSTIGGYITQQLGRFPVKDESLKILDFDAKIINIQGTRVGQIHFTRCTQEENEEENS